MTIDELLEFIAENELELLVSFVGGKKISIKSLSNFLIKYSEDRVNHTRDGKSILKFSYNNLKEYFGKNKNGRVYIPTKETYNKFIRNRAILEDWSKNILSTKELAEKYSLSLDSIYLILGTTVRLKRKQSILIDWKNRSLPIPELAKKYSLSVNSIYMILDGALQ